MNYIITKHPEFFEKIGKYNFAPLDALSTIPNKIAFDSETTGLSSVFDDMFCVQIGTGSDNYIIHMYDDNYTFEDVIPYIKDCVFVMQNGAFDVGFMFKHKFIPKYVYDTMLASKIIYNGDYLNKRHDFGSIMLRELGIVYDKTDQKNIHIVKLSQASAIKYSFNDVDKLLECHDVLEEKIKDKGYEKTYDLHCKFILPLAYMERCGLPLDAKMWYNKMQVDYENMLKFKEIVEEYIFDNLPQFANIQIDLFDNDVKKKIHISTTSPKQMIQVFKALEIPCVNKKTGGDSIKEDIISKSDHEFVQLWLNYQGALHRVTTFGDNIYQKIQENGRIYTVFNPAVDTARLASRKNSINFLNFPADAETRDCFQAKAGNKMIVCDWSGQETVIMADVSGDKAMTKAVQEGLDLHCMLAREIYPELKDLSDQEIIDNHSGERKDAKAPRFAMQYGGNAYTLHTNEKNMSMEKATHLFESFIVLHKELMIWGEKKFRESVRKGYVESASGWKLHLFKFDIYKELEKEINAITREEWQLYREGKAEYKRYWAIQDYNKEKKPEEPKKQFICLNEEAYAYYREKKKPVSEFFKMQSEYKRVCLNNPIQTTGAHQMKLALIMIFDEIVTNGYFDKVLLCNAVHDETVSEAPEELAEWTKNTVQSCMRRAGDYYLKTLNIKADAAIGNSWYEAK